MLLITLGAATSLKRCPAITHVWNQKSNYSCDIEKEIG